MNGQLFILIKSFALNFQYNLKFSTSIFQFITKYSGHPVDHPKVTIDHQLRTTGLEGDACSLCARIACLCRAPCAWITVLCPVD